MEKRGDRGQGQEISTLQETLKEVALLRGQKLLPHRESKITQKQPPRPTLWSALRTELLSAVFRKPE